MYVSCPALHLLVVSLSPQHDIHPLIGVLLSINSLPSILSTPESSSLWVSAGLLSRTTCESCRGVYPSDSIAILFFFFFFLFLGVFHAFSSLTPSSETISNSIFFFSLAWSQRNGFNLLGLMNSVSLSHFLRYLSSYRPYDTTSRPGLSRF